VAELFRRAFSDRARSLAAWCVGVALYVAMLAAVFPSIHRSNGFETIVKNYPDALKKIFGLTGGLDFTTGVGYVDAELFSFILPTFVLAVAIGAGATLIAGDEEHGLLDVWLACPITRTGLMAARAAVVLTECILLPTAIVVALAVADPIVNFDLPHGRLVSAGVSLALLGIFHGWLALLVGAGTRHRTTAIGIPAAVAAFGYIVSTLHSLASWLGPFRWISPFYYAGQNPLANSPHIAYLTVLALGSVVVVLVAVVLFERRDVVAG
jgi:ABC-2 type transport system permease protein